MNITDIPFFEFLRWFNEDEFTQEFYGVLKSLWQLECRINVENEMEIMSGGIYLSVDIDMEEHGVPARTAREKMVKINRILSQYNSNFENKYYIEWQGDKDQKYSEVKDKNRRLTLIEPTGKWEYIVSIKVNNAKTTKKLRNFTREKPLSDEELIQLYYELESYYSTYFFKYQSMYIQGVILSNILIKYLNDDIIYIVLEYF